MSITVVNLYDGHIQIFSETEEKRKEEKRNTKNREKGKSELRCKQKIKKRIRGIVRDMRDYGTKVSTHISRVRTSTQKNMV